MPVGPILLVTFLAIPLVEVALFVQIGGWIGLWLTLAAIVATALLGSFVIRRQGFDLARRAQGRLAGGGVPVREAFDGLCLVVAGLLMITPGFFTDAVGGALLIPPLRSRLYRRIAERVEVQVGRQRQSPSAPAADVVDADFEVLDDDDEASPPRMPPPRGRWDRPEG